MVPAGLDNQGCTVLILRMWLIPVLEMHSQYWNWPHSQSGTISNIIGLKILAVKFTYNDTIIAATRLWLVCNKVVTMLSHSHNLVATISSVVISELDCIWQIFHSSCLDCNLEN